MDIDFIIGVCIGVLFMIIGIYLTKDILLGRWVEMSSVQIGSSEIGEHLDKVIVDEINRHIILINKQMGESENKILKDTVSHSNKELKRIKKEIVGVLKTYINEEVKNEKNK